MKYKYCPDCGSKMTHSRSLDGWAEYYDCDIGCHLRISIEHGETMHAQGDKEKWIRVAPEPRKPREWEVVEVGDGIVKATGFEPKSKVILVREVIE